MCQYFNFKFFFFFFLEEKRLDPVLHKQNDIGFPFLKPSRSAELRQRLDHLKKQRSDSALEKLARSQSRKFNRYNSNSVLRNLLFSVEINLEETKQEWLRTAGPFHIRSIAEHYGIFEHLFGKHAYFTPRINLDIKFKLPEDTFCPVYYGNRIKPSEAEKEPEVKFNPNFSIDGGKTTDKESLWTLVLTNPDGHFTEENQEYVHWMV